MKSVTLLQPPRIAVGNGCAPECARYLGGRGARRVLLVSSSAVQPSLGGVLEAMRQAGIEVVEAPAVDCEPTVAMFEAALKVARDGRVDAVAGIGGGSAMDVAKLVAALGDGGQPIREVFGIDLLKRRALPLVCLPTTAGTGAEVSPNAILLDETDEMKKGVISPHLVPDAAFVDPLLTLSVPPAVTAATGLDALTHCIEAFANKHAHPAVDTYALAGIRLISANLVGAVRDGKDVEARAALALGSLYGGLCLGPVNTAAVHALAYPLGGKFHVAHGVSNAVMLPAVLRFNLPAAAERYAQMALALGVQQNGADLAEAGVRAIEELARACGIPMRLSELGIPRSAIPELARSAMQVTRLLRNNPRTLTEADAISLYESVF
ncbi:MAG TPA: iron-containing alcohol dehydrogenase [Verrucomicrobia bacterium]|nr:iron-containing alcohol dehydrogenase [Verrucomicrobiota bacterium]HOB31326.1 iron-containing alcohol dehydrogenase [Verrucomicrobiota bacterium]HOP98566.1 iron-containing alcohol dehydrogenase [Verrucomicrobiota bacterium]